MRILVAIDQRLSRTPDGAVWTRIPPAYEFFGLHLTVFDEVLVVARLVECEVAPPGARRVDGPRVSVAAMPCYAGPWGYARKAVAVERVLKATLRLGDAVLLRGPSQLGNRMTRLLTRGFFGVEVLADPWELYAPGANASVLRPVWRRWFTRHLRAQCRAAAVVGYVSRRLAQRYPSCGESECYSDVELHEVAEARTGPHPGRGRKRIVTTGHFDYPVKGHDVLICALASMKTEAELEIIGTGRMERDLLALAESLGVGSRVQIAGELGGPAAVAARFDEADIYALASRSEGMPRAMIEAMARGLPAVGTRAGGIPELLHESQLVAVNDARGLAERLDLALGDPATYRRWSRHSVSRASDFAGAENRAARLRLLTTLRDAGGHR